MICTGRLLKTIPKKGRSFYHIFGRHALRWVPTHCDAWRQYAPTITIKMKYKNPNENRFQKGSPRLFGYDYAHEGYYFITICTKDRRHYFGEINNGEMILSDSGKIVYQEWRLTAEIRKDMMVSLDDFCIMPNHLHAIIVIGDPVLPSYANESPHQILKSINLARR